MADYVIPPPPQASVPVAGGGHFPVRRVYCVGRNYAEHAREMGHAPDEEPPFFFSKPADALVTGGADVPYPTMTANFHHEIELVVALGAGGRDVPSDRAMDLVWGYAVGIDLTRRDLQAWAKGAKKPWEVAKGFDHSGPVGDLVPAARVALPLRGRISLAVNGEERQSGDLADMIWDVPHILAELSRYFELCPGDLIFTGTPAGVAPLVRGDHVRGEIAGIGAVETRIT